VLTVLQVAYCTTVFKPIVQRMGVEFDVDVDQRYGHLSFVLFLVSPTTRVAFVLRP
jgi:hypothetical protein